MAVATGAGLTGTGSGAGTACTIWSGGVGDAAGSGWTVAVAGAELTWLGVVTGAAGSGWIIGRTVFDAMVTGARLSGAVGKALEKPGCGRAGACVCEDVCGVGCAWGSGWTIGIGEAAATTRGVVVDAICTGAGVTGVVLAAIATPRALRPPRRRSSRVVTGAGAAAE